jgi:hypothetical protein
MQAVQNAAGAKMSLPEAGGQTEDTAEGKGLLGGPWSASDSAHWFLQGHRFSQGHRGRVRRDLSTAYFHLSWLA